MCAIYHLVYPTTLSDAASPFHLHFNVHVYYTAHDNFLLNSGQVGKESVKSDTLYYIIAYRTKKYNVDMDRLLIQRLLVFMNTAVM